jgi:hypothetical protein
MAVEVNGVDDYEGCLVFETRAWKCQMDNMLDLGISQSGGSLFTKGEVWPT